MKADELRRLFPNASEKFISDNASQPAPQIAPTPAPARAEWRRGKTRAADAPGGGPRRQQRAMRTRNGGAWTEARYWQAVRSALRRAFRFWQPAVAALRAARVPWPGPRGRKHGYRCARCGELFLRTDVEIDHVEPCGAMKRPEEIATFLSRLTPESPDAYQILCVRTCHRAKIEAERAARHSQ